MLTVLSYSKLILKNAIEAASGTVPLTLSSNYQNHEILYKEVNRKIQGVPQSQTTANPQHQVEEKNDDKN